MSGGEPSSIKQSTLCAAVNRLIRTPCHTVIFIFKLITGSEKMAYKALYRKYRPLTFSDVSGQEHITETLKGELKAGKISHAYLFTGTRGTGKTSCAKILARAVNCESLIDGDPCLECEACRMALSEEATDIVEMDAASNNSVEDVRMLREQITFTPTSLKYRVYIIDEVHMLSGAAFNALLKTLEEPPEHVIFILATTEVHKLPATILSRCQRFDFHRIEMSKIVERIFRIAEMENFTITEEAANLIAAAADGGMRDALSILDLCLSGSTEITEQTVTDSLGMSGNEYLTRLSESILDGNCENALSLIDELHKNSVDMLRLANELSSFFRDIMIVKTVKSEKKPVVCSSEQLEVYKKLAEKFDIKDIMRALNMLWAAVSDMQTANRRSVLELTIIKLCDPALSADFDSLEKRIRALESGAVRVAPAEPVKKAEEPVKPEPVKKQIEELPDEEIPLPEAPYDAEPVIYTEPVTSGSSDETPVAEWSEVLKVLAKTNPLMVGVLNGSKAYISGNYLLIDAPNPQFKDLINKKETIYRDSLRNAAAEVLGATYKLGPYRAKQESQEENPLKQLENKLKKLEVPRN